MGKQLFNGKRKMLSISLIVFIMSSVVAVVSAQPQAGGGGAALNVPNITSGNLTRCGWACNNPASQLHCDRWIQRQYCDRGHWCLTASGQRIWKCDSLRHTGWVCTRWNRGSFCNNWIQRCCR